MAIPPVSPSTPRDQIVKSCTTPPSQKPIYKAAKAVDRVGLVRLGNISSGAAVKTPGASAAS